jgi:hypothetical protein
VDGRRQNEEIRRMGIMIKIERARGLIADYEEGIRFYADRINTYHDLLGRIGERLGELEPEEP